MSDSLQPHGLQSARLHKIFQARILEWVAAPFSMGFPNPRSEPRAPALQEYYLPSEPLRKPPPPNTANNNFLHILKKKKLHYQFTTKDCNTGTARWKKCIGQGVGRGHGSMFSVSPSLFPSLQMVTNPETPYMHHSKICR